MIQSVPVIAKNLISVEWKPMIGGSFTPIKGVVSAMFSLGRQVSFRTSEEHGTEYVPGLGRLFGAIYTESHQQAMQLMSLALSESTPEDTNNMQQLRFNYEAEENRQIYRITVTRIQFFGFATIMLPNRAATKEKSLSDIVRIPWYCRTSANTFSLIEELWNESLIGRATEQTR